MPGKLLLKGMDICSYIRVNLKSNVNFVHSKMCYYFHLCLNLDIWLELYNPPALTCFQDFSPINASKCSLGFVDQT